MIVSCDESLLSRLEREEPTLIEALEVLRGGFDFFVIFLIKLRGSCVIYSFWFEFAEILGVA